MRTLPLVLAVAALPLLNGTAEARPDARKMTCAAVNALVRAEGVVVVTTGQYTYQRYVDDIAFCEFDQMLKPDIVPTRDNPRCEVYSMCAMSPFYDLPGFGD